MKVFFSKCLIFSILLVAATSYSLTGEWKLKNIDGENTDNAITLGIEQKVTQNGEIKNILHFRNCYNILYEVKIQQNYMSFEKNVSNQTNQKNDQINLNHQCSQEESKLQKRISETLKKVFWFAIKSDLLVFISPNGNDIFQFSRVKKVYLTQLVGAYIMDKVYWQRALLTKAKIEKQKAYFCDGKIETTVHTNNIDEISFNVTKNDDCEQANLTKALGNVRYYRIKDIQIQFYDQDSVQIMQLAYQEGGNGLEQTEVVLNAKSDTSIKGAIIIIENEEPVKVDQTIQSNLRAQQQIKIQTPVVIEGDGS